MKFDKAGSKVKQVREVAGLITAIFDHEIKASTAKVEYTGPKITQDLWDQVLAFLQWSQDTTHSEAQMRLFVNTKDKCWSAWAFPQICGTGMTTKEISDASPERDAQRAQFLEKDGWIPFGTIHHHCTASAFQSGTDEADEVNQDGLHITIGNLGAKAYSIHCRFYIAGHRFDPNMSLFWDIGKEVLEQVPSWCKTYLPAGIEDKIARAQMCDPAPKGTTFPEVWKTNLIEKKAEVHTYPVGQWYPGGYESGSVCSGDYAERLSNGRYINTDFDMKRAKKAFRELMKEYGEPNVANRRILEIMTSLLEILDANKGFPIEDFLITCHECDVSPDKFLAYLQKTVAKGKDDDDAVAKSPTTTGMILGNEYDTTRSSSGCWMGD